MENKSKKKMQDKFEGIARKVAMLPEDEYVEFVNSLQQKLDDMKLSIGNIKEKVAKIDKTPRFRCLSNESHNNIVLGSAIATELIGNALLYAKLYPFTTDIADFILLVVNGCVAFRFGESLGNMLVDKIQNRTISNKLNDFMRHIENKKLEKLTKKSDETNKTLVAIKYKRVANNIDTSIDIFANAENDANEQAEITMSK